MKLTVFAVELVAWLSPATLLAQEIPPPAKVGAGPLIASEFIFELEQRPTPQCHASTIVETPQGLVAAWFGGTREGHNDVGIWLARQGADGWSRPKLLATGSEGEERDYPCWNPVLFQPSAGPLMLFYKVGPNPRAWWGMLLTSRDHGASWSQPRKLGVSQALGEENPNLIGPVKNKPLELNGEILCPSSTEHRGWRVHFERSSDGGQTWEVVGPIHDATRFNAIQPSILQHGDDRLQILCRSREQHVVESWSQDGGDTWSKLAATSLPNPNAGTDAVTLADGRHLIVYNHTIRAGEFPSGRNMLNVAVSDDGETWRVAITLERARGEFSYPAVIQTSDGRIHITYTWRRETIRHAVLDASKL